MAPSLVSTLDPPSLGPKNPVYSNVTIVPLSDTMKMITVAGQVATTPTDEVPETLAAQMDLCLSKVLTCLEASGARIEDMTRFMYYFTERAWEQEDALKLAVDTVMPWLKGHRPASCCLIVKSLSEPRFLCEFEAQAVVRSE